MTTTPASMKRLLTKRVTAALAAAAAVLGIIAFGFTGGSTSDQADEPWNCNRDGTICYDY